MNQDWERAIEFVLRMEGGAEAERVTGDPGGLTKFGISQKSYPKLDIANLTIDDAKAIYRRDYWEACNCDSLPTAFAIATFDSAVNQGTGVAARILQLTLGVEADGVVGDKTITAAHKADPSRVRVLLAQRMAAYLRLMDEKPNLKIFAVNWSNRVLSLWELLLKG